MHITHNLVTEKCFATSLSPDQKDKADRSDITPYFARYGHYVAIKEEWVDIK